MGCWDLRCFSSSRTKNIAAAVREGAATGVARYLATGRPLANQHQTWKDSYCAYWKSHYAPAIRLAMLYLVYHLLAGQTFQGRLPMFLVVISFTSWIITPIIFSPFPRWSLIEQDVREFTNFINGRAGMAQRELAEVVDRGQKGLVRTVFECGLADAIGYWTDMPFIVLVFNLTRRILFCIIISMALPAEIMDFQWIYLVVLSLQWVFVLGFFAFGLNNILLVLSLVVWLVVLPFGQCVIGARAQSPTLSIRLPEYIISLFVFLEFLNLAEHFVLVGIRGALHVKAFICCFPQDQVNLRLHQWVRLAHVYFLRHQLHKLQAYIVLLANLFVALFLAMFDKLLGNLHTWWLLNEELARTKQREQYLENRPPLLDQDAHRHGQSWTDATTSVPADGSEQEGSSTSEAAPSAEPAQQSYTVLEVI